MNPPPAANLATTALTPPAPRRACPIPHPRRWTRGAAVITFLFFALKGLCWLAIPAIAAAFATR